MNRLLLILDDSGISAIPVALRIATAAQDSLTILCISRAADASRIETVSADAADPTPLPRAAHAAVAAATPTIAVTVCECRTPRPHRAVLDAIAELEARHLIIPASVEGKADPVRTVVRRLARVAPVDVLLIDVGSVLEPPARILVPQLGGGGAHALRCALRAFDTDVRAIADSAAPARSHRVFTRVRDRLPEPRRTRLALLDEEPGSHPIDTTLAQAVQAGDLVLLDAEEAAHVLRLITLLATLRRDKQDVPFAVGVTRAADAAGPGRLERAVERFRLHLPTLSRDQRREVYELLEARGQLSTDFVVMLVLSAAIAALGLIQSSAAVVIGAML
ncbi:MAG: hypothetical protein KDA21_12065, partial [Phycisphaerales bacterium]|nr:hypothetical protein [Phycisphaerales bacterium]